MAWGACLYRSMSFTKISVFGVDLADPLAGMKRQRKKRGDWVLSFERFPAVS